MSYLKDLIDYQAEEIRQLKALLLKERAVMRPKIISDPDVSEREVYLTMHSSLLDECGKILDFGGERWRVQSVNRVQCQITLEKY